MHDPTAPSDRLELGQELLARGELVVTATGGSMAPTVATGTRVRVRPIPALPGDVALFRTRSSFLLHRVLARLPGGLVVHRGDAPGSLPGLARERDLLGRADLPRLTVGRIARWRGVLAALRGHLIR